MKQINSQTILKFNEALNLLSNQMNKVFKTEANNEITLHQPLYMNSNMLNKELAPIYRFDRKGMRFYFTINNSIPAPFLAEDGVVHDIKAEDIITFYPSVTTIIEKTTPTSYGIKKLIGDMGLSGFYSYMKERAHYGTILHTFITDYLRSSDVKSERAFNSDDIKGRIDLYAEEHYFDFDYSNWHFDMHKDLRSLIQFIWDYDVEPIAIECVGYYDDGKNRFAGAIDLICEMTIEEKGFFGETYKSGEKKGEPKETKRPRRITAIVDFKSGKAGFFQDHEVQLHMYKKMAQGYFGLEIEKVFNVAPKDWQDSPAYHIKDQTDSVEGNRIPYLLGAFFLDYEAPKEILIMSGKINGSGDMSDNCKHISAAEYVWNKIKSKNN